MWKPGTSRPVSNGDTEKVEKSKSHKGGGGGGSAKKLSSSTMGMRFMQRKNDAKSKEHDERKEVARAHSTRKHAASAISERGANDRALDRKRASNDISKDERQSTNSDGGAIILELASVVDMYGVGSDVVGRRSFGGFHKSVRNSYDAALKRRVDDDARAKNTKAHITDEELLERYEKYVKGRGGDKQGSGNRGRKDKRKRND